MSSDDGGPDAVPSADEVVTVADIEAARERLDDVIHRTPLDRSTTFAERSGVASVGLKLENMQRTGSFKIRGAYNKMVRLRSDARERGVVASSAGNHAQGVALAGQLCGVETTIVVPEVTPAAKIEATRGYGAEVLVEGDIYERSYQRALDLADDEGLTFVHPFDDERIIAGQGTVGLELVEQYPELDTVLVAIGGGGLISGIGTALKDRDPNIRVIGVQPEGASHAKPSLESDEIRELPGVDTVAEGIADTRLLEKTFAVVVSGGNVDLTEHGELARIGLRELGRCAEVRLGVEHWPTDLAAVAETIESRGAELDAMERARRTASDDPNRTPVTAGVAGSGPDHLAETLAALDDLDGIAVEDTDFTGR